MGRNTVLTDDIKEKITTLSREGFGVRRIANAVGISKSSVDRFLREGRDVNRIKSDENTITGGVNIVDTPSASAGKVIEKYSSKLKVFNKVPHALLITDVELEKIKSLLGNPKLNYYQLHIQHQKECKCYSCSMIRKKNWFLLKKWANQNINYNDKEN